MIEEGREKSGTEDKAVRGEGGGMKGVESTKSMS